MKHYIAILILGVIGFAPITFVHAQTEEVKDARHEVMESVNKLSELNENETILSEEEYAETEILLKKNILEGILALSSLETEDIQEKLVAIKDDVKEEQLLQLHEDLFESLDAYLEYFSALNTLLQATDTLDGIRTIANQFKEWRETTYNPEVTRVIDFILVFQTKTILNIADQRSERIESELQKSEFIGLESIDSLLDAALQNLFDAQELHDRAFTLLLEYAPDPEVELIETDEELLKEEEELLIDEEETQAVTEEEVEKIEIEISETEESPSVDEEETLTIRELVQESLLMIRSAYGNFIELTSFLKDK